MPQSLVKNYIHIIFSTKERYPFIDNSISKELYSYLGGICKNLESYPVKIGGISDHVHILCLLSRKIALMKLVEELKSHSSNWIKSKGQKYRKFYWQNGYGGFSVNPTQLEVVQKYIQNQKEHHRKSTFQDEYRVFLKKYDMEFDERYVWD
jgi:REP element-mobilizing transposase RayT